MKDLYETLKKSNQSNQDAIIDNLLEFLYLQLKDEQEFEGVNDTNQSLLNRVALFLKQKWGDKKNQNIKLKDNKLKSNFN